MPSPRSTASETVYTYGWEGLSLCWVKAASAQASSRLTYLFDENDRAYAASYEATRSGVATATVLRTLVTDHGDVVGLSSGSGSPFALYRYGPFGEAESAISTAVAGSISASLAAEIAAANPLRYAGYAFDTWSGSYYLQARYYDPTTRQFISRDPAEADGEESAYQYCGGDPIQLVDPTGMWGFSFGGMLKAVKRRYTRARASVNRAVARVKTVARVAFKSVSRSVKAKVRKVRRWASAKKARVSHYYHRASKRFAKRGHARTGVGLKIKKKKVLLIYDKTDSTNYENESDFDPQFITKETLAEAARLRALPWLDVEAVGVGSPEEMYAVLKAQRPGSVDDLRVNTHANSSAVYINHKEVLPSRIDGSLLSARGHTTLYGCNAGEGGARSPAQRWANATGRTVHANRDETRGFQLNRPVWAYPQARGAD